MKSVKYVLALTFLCAALILATRPAAAQYQNNNQYPSNTNQYPAQNQYPQEQQQPVYNNGNISQDMIPAGAQVQIRTNEAINATKQDVGRTFSAEIADNVIGQSGQILIPKGSPATLQVASTGTSTMGVGSNEVALALQSVSINGRTYNVQSNPVKQSGDRGVGANKRTAEMTGGGALLGTVIGAVAGGGKGAAIGAVLGGVGGATAQVLTRGNEVKVPAETLLTFKLDQPLSLQ